MTKFKKWRLGAMTGMACVALAAPALATPINPINTRPVTVNSPSSDGSDLQTKVNSYIGGNINVQTDQQSAGMWTATGTSGISQVPTFEYQNGNPDDAFGIWFGTDTDTSDPSKFLRIELFHPGTSVGTGVTLDKFTPGSVRVSGAEYGSTQTFNDPLITPFGLGFYVANSTGTFYTVDQLNVNGEADALAFRNGSNWAFGFEDSIGDTTHNYNDYIVKTESLDPVPEPGTLVLFGTALLGLAFGLRNWRERRTE